MFVFLCRAAAAAEWQWWGCGGAVGVLAETSLTLACHGGACLHKPITGTDGIAVSTRSRQIETDCDALVTSQGTANYAPGNANYARRQELQDAASEQQRLQRLRCVALLCRACSSPTCQLANPHFGSKVILIWSLCHMGRD